MVVLCFITLYFAANNFLPIFPDFFTQRLVFGLSISSLFLQRFVSYCFIFHMKNKIFKNKNG